MPKCTIRPLARGLLALTLLSWGFSAGPAPGQPARLAQADEIDCEDRDNFDDPECVRQRPPAAEPESAPAPPAEQAPPDAPPPADAVARATDPGYVVFRLEDAGKEAIEYASEQGTDKYGRWARTRYERPRNTSSSQLGPAVIETRAWVAKDVETGKTLFKDQEAIKNFPERKESVNGPNEKFKYVNVAEETSAVSGYHLDRDGRVWQHYRIVLRKGGNVAVMYLFGETSNRDPKKDVMSNELVGWFSQKLAGRL